MERMPITNFLLNELKKVHQTGHRFNQLLLRGKLSKKQLQCWAKNWYYFERSMPKKDAAIISNCDEIEIRRLWVKKILEHDGYAGKRGSIEDWLNFAYSVGLSSSEMKNEEYLEDVVRTVDDYIEFAKKRDWLEGIATSAGLMLVPDLTLSKLNALQMRYAWIDEDGLDFFRSLYTKSLKDGKIIIEIISSYTNSDSLKKRVVEAAKYGASVQNTILEAVLKASD